MENNTSPQLSTFNCQLLIVNCKLIGRSGYAVGLSAISLLAPSPPHSPSHSPFPVPAWLAKDAAPIPNAFLSHQVSESLSHQVDAMIKFVRTH